MEAVHEFINKLQGLIVAEAGGTKRYHFALKLLNDNGWRSVRDIPEDQRETFLEKVRQAPNHG
jgi:hypothetical protein